MLGRVSIIQRRTTSPPLPATRRRLRSSPLRPDFFGAFVFPDGGDSAPPSRISHTERRANGYDSVFLGSRSRVTASPCSPPFSSSSSVRWLGGPNGGSVVSRSGRVRYALLVDAENTSPRILGPILSEVTVGFGGDVPIRRLYGDFNLQYLSSWLGASELHSCELMESVPYTKGKNSADFALTIDAMDLLHNVGDDLGGFCIVSSDSDFTCLALRLRRARKHVLGFGKSSTPQCFVHACDHFTYTRSDACNHQMPPENVNLLRSVLREVSQETMERDGWIMYRELVSHLSNNDIDFYEKGYGYKSLFHWVISLRDDFEVNFVKSVPFVRIKPGSLPNEEAGSNEIVI